MRKAIISRTMLVTAVKAFCVDVETQETFENEQEIPRTYKDPKKLEKAVRSAVETDRVKMAYIISAEPKKKLYAMTEEDFLTHSKEITGRSAAETAILFGADEIEEAPEN